MDRIEEIEDALTLKDAYWALAMMKEGHSVQHCGDTVLRGIRNGVVKCKKTDEHLWKAVHPDNPNEWPSAFGSDARFELYEEKHRTDRR